MAPDAEAELEGLGVTNVASDALQSAIVEVRALLYDACWACAVGWAHLVPGPTFRRGARPRRRPSSGLARPAAIFWASTGELSGS